MTHIGRGKARITLVIPIVLALSAAAPAAGQSETDRGMWTDISVQGRMGDSSWRWKFDSTVRARDDASTLDLLAGRVMVTRDLTRRSGAGIGYAYGAGFPHRSVLREHQFIQQYVWSTGAAWRVSLNSRLEERFVTGHDAVLLRWRQRARVTWPLGASGRLHGVAAGELSATTNSTARTPRGFEADQVLVGIGRTLTTHTDVEIGYVNVYSRGGSSRSRHTHVVSATLGMSL